MTQNGRPKGTPKTGGRKKGTTNKQTSAARVAMREAIHLAAEQTGADGKGKDGLVGYLQMIAATDIKTFCKLISRTIPTTVEDKSDQPHNVVIEHKYAPDPKQRVGT